MTERLFLALGRAERIIIILIIIVILMLIIIVVITLIAHGDLRPATRDTPESHSACRALHLESKKEDGAVSISFCWSFALAKEM